MLAIAILQVLLGYGLWHGEGQTAGAEEMVALRRLFVLALVPGVVSLALLVAKVREVAPTCPVDGNDSAAATATPLPRRFYLFVAIVTLFALGNSSDLFIVLYGKTKFGLGLAQVIGLWVLLHVSKIVFSFPGGILSDRLGRRPVIVAGWLVYAAVYLGIVLLLIGVLWHLWRPVLAGARP